MARTKQKKTKSRRFFSEEFKQEAVQMLLDGHSALPSRSDWDSGTRCALPLEADFCNTPGQPLAHLGNAYISSKGAETRGARTGHLKKSVGYLKPPR